MVDGFPPPFCCFFCFIGDNRDDDDAAAPPVSTSGKLATQSCDGGDVAVDEDFIDEDDEDVFLCVADNADLNDSVDSLSKSTDAEGVAFKGGLGDPVPETFRTTEGHKGF
jgi:hypothetical protein